MPQIPVKAQAQPDQVCTIVNIAVVSGDYGDQIQVDFQTASGGIFSRWFPFSSHQSSKWIKFVNSFNDARGEPVSDASEMVGTTIALGEKQESGEIQGEHRTWNVPIVKAIKKDGNGAAAAPLDEVPFDAAQALVEQYEAHERNDKKFWTAVKGWGYSQKAVGKVIKEYKANPDAFKQRPAPAQVQDDDDDDFFGFDANEEEEVTF